MVPTIGRNLQVDVRIVGRAPESRSHGKPLQEVLHVAARGNVCDVDLTNKRHRKAIRRGLEVVNEEIAVQA